MTPTKVQQKQGVMILQREVGIIQRHRVITDGNEESVPGPLPICLP